MRVRDRVGVSVRGSVRGRVRVRGKVRGKVRVRLLAWHAGAAPSKRASTSARFAASICAFSYCAWLG